MAYPFLLTNCQLLLDPSDPDSLTTGGYDFNGTSDYLKHAAPVVTAYPFTVSLWFKSDVAQTTTVFAMGDEATNNEHWSVAYVSGGAASCASRTGGVNSTATTSALGTDTDWHHILAVFTSATSRTIVLDGDWAGRGTNSTNSTPTGLDNTTIGALERTAGLSFFNGKVAAVTVWAAVPGDPETVATQLAGGADPRTVACGSLQNLWPLSAASLLTDEVGAADLSEVSSPGAPDSKVIAIANRAGQGPVGVLNIDPTTQPILTTMGLGSLVGLSFTGSDYLQVDSTVLTAAPLSVTIAALCNQNTAQATAFFLGNSALAGDWFSVDFSGATSGDPIRWVVIQASGAQFATGAGYTIGQIYTATGIETSSTDRDVYVDGVLGTPNTAARTPSGVNRMAIGMRRDLSPSTGLDGSIGGVALFSDAGTERVSVELWASYWRDGLPVPTTVQYQRKAKTVPPHPNYFLGYFTRRYGFAADFNADPEIHVAARKAKTVQLPPEYRRGGFFARRNGFSEDINPNPETRITHRKSKTVPLHPKSLLGSFSRRLGSPDPIVEIRIPFRLSRAIPGHPSALAGHFSRRGGYSKDIISASVGNSIVFAGFAGRHLDVSISNSFSFFHDAATNVKFLQVRSSFTLSQDPATNGSEYLRSLIHQFLFESTANRTLEGSATNSILFDQEAARAAQGLNELLFQGVVTYEQCKHIISEILFDQSVAFSHDRAYLLNSACTWVGTVVGVLVGVNGNCALYDYNPNGPLPVISLGIRSGVRLESGAFNIELPNPLFGNGDEVDPKRILRRSRGGTIQITRDPIWPKKTTLEMSFTTLTRTLALALLTFLSGTLGQLVTLTDQENQTWDGVILNPDGGIGDIQGDKDCNYSANLVFIGERT